MVTLEVCWDYIDSPAFLCKRWLTPFYTEMPCGHFIIQTFFPFGERSAALLGLVLFLQNRLNIIAFSLCQIYECFVCAEWRFSVWRGLLRYGRCSLALCGTPQCDTTTVWHTTMWHHHSVASFGNSHCSAHTLWCCVAHSVKLGKGCHSVTLWCSVVFVVAFRLIGTL